MDQMLLDGMEPREGSELRELFDKVQDWFKRSARDSILRHYELGKLANELLAKDLVEGKDAAGPRYGSRALSWIAQANGGEEARALIRQAVLFVRAFTREEAEALTKRLTPQGRPLSWSHVRTLVEVQDAAQRQELLDRTLREGWTCTQLAHEVVRLHREQPTKRGRPLATPKTFAQVVRQQEAAADQFLTRAEKAWNGEHSLSARAQDLSPDEVTDERVEEVKEHAAKLRKLADQATAQAEQAERVYARFQEVLAKRRERAVPAGPLPHGDLFQGQPCSYGALPEDSAAESPLSACSPEVP